MSDHWGGGVLQVDTFKAQPYSPHQVTRKSCGNKYLCLAATSDIRVATYTLLGLDLQQPHTMQACKVRGHPSCSILCLTTPLLHTHIDTTLCLTPLFPPILTILCQQHLLQNLAPDTPPSFCQ
jgi:hypothetical protein